MINNASLDMDTVLNVAGSSIVTFDLEVATVARFQSTEAMILLHGYNVITSGFLAFFSLNIVPRITRLFCLPVYQTYLIRARLMS